MKLLVELFHLPEEEILNVYQRFQSATKGEKSLNRRKFSDIMHQCFPRTHKVKTYTDLVFISHYGYFAPLTEVKIKRNGIT